MKITRNNYEEFFLDYLEGNLDESLYDQFIEFLQGNPELKEELKSLTTYSTEPEEIVFSGKDKLYKSKYDSQKEFDFTAVAAIEGDLDPAEEIQFRDYLAKNPAKEKEFDTIKKTKLVADETIVFAKKPSIHKTTGVRRFLYYTSRIAAVLILVFSVGVFLKYYSEVETPAKQIVKQTTEPIQSPKVETQSVADKVAPMEKSFTPTVFAQAKKSEPKGQPEPVASVIEVAKPNERLQEIRSAVAVISYSTAMVEDPLELVAMNRSLLPQKTFDPADETEKPLLGDVIKEKAGIESLSFSTVAKAGLRLVSSLSKNKVSYDTNKEGNVTEINFDSRLLAFSIPVQNSRSRE
jgi:hypothetical protein